MRRPTRRTFKIAALVLAAPIVVCAAVMGFLSLRPRVEAYRHAITFEPAAWKARSRDNDFMWPTRLRMIDDLLQRHLLEDATRARVEALLGPADDTPYFRQWDLVYHLGPERGFMRIDSEWLVLRLGQAGRVTEYRVVRD